VNENRVHQDGVGNVRVKALLYTDGSATKGAGGWAAVWVRPGLEPAYVAAPLESATSQRAELEAAIGGLTALPEHAEVELRSDSQYVVKGFTSWLPRWMRNGMVNADGNPVANTDLWLALLDASVRHGNVTMTWVRGHVGETWNELADKVAGRARTELHRAETWRDIPLADPAPRTRRINVVDPVLAAMSIDDLLALLNEVGHYKKAARRLGVSERHLTWHCRRLNIRRPSTAERAEGHGFEVSDAPVTLDNRAGWSSEDVEAALELAGGSNVELAQMLGVDVADVDFMIRRAAKEKLKKQG